MNCRDYPGMSTLSTS